jgi:hypothetical protein
MAAPNQHALSRHFTQLLGREVTFVPSSPLQRSTAKQIYGVYTVFPSEAAVVVQSDLPLVGSFAGALVGLPDSAVKEHLRATPVEELMRDAMYEVLNIASGAIATEGRTVLNKVVTDPASIDGAAANVLKKPGRKFCFSVTIDEYQGGIFAIIQ